MEIYRRRILVGMYPFQARNSCELYLKIGFPGEKKNAYAVSLYESEGRSLLGRSR